MQLIWDLPGYVNNSDQKNNYLNKLTRLL